MNTSVFRLRDYEYAQPLYDLAFVLEVDAISRGLKKPKYRTFALWKAALALDSYGTIVDRWLAGELNDNDLDQVPSSRIRGYLESIRDLGAILELASYLENDRYLRSLQLRRLRGLGPVQIAQTLDFDLPPRDWLDQASKNCGLPNEAILDCLSGKAFGTWQAAHIIPPLLRLLQSIETAMGRPILWHLEGVTDVFSAIDAEINVSAELDLERFRRIVRTAVRRDVMFQLTGKRGVLRAKHVQGWTARFTSAESTKDAATAQSLLERLDPLGNVSLGRVKSDLHMHTSWSDGSAALSAMAEAAQKNGLSHIAVTDHSRSCKLQSGLTPVEWLRQSNSLMFVPPTIPVLHGIEVDILGDGRLDLPTSILAAADLVVASVHSNWTNDIESNTRRLISAVESGVVDVLGHPTSALTGKPGVPNFVRSSAEIEWGKVFACCARWQVAVEFNCFPSRFDLPFALLLEALEAGCWLSLGSDAHSRAHLHHIRFGEEIARRTNCERVLNYLSHDEIIRWRSEARRIRSLLRRSTGAEAQRTFSFEEPLRRDPILARLNPTPRVAAGSPVVGLDLTGSDKATGVAFMSGQNVTTCSLVSDDELVQFIQSTKPRIVSIDSPLGLPGGGSEIDPSAGIVRLAEHDLSSIGISAYPALIDSMKELTLRGIRLRKRIETLDFSPTVIESYPGAAQDILCLPRKQRGLSLLRQGLRNLGLTGTGLDSISHDEIDAITSAVVGRFYENGDYEAMGVEAEAQLIVPKHKLLSFERPPVICLAGKTGAGKSVVARYFAVMYGFHWFKTRDLIRALIVDDSSLPKKKRLFSRSVEPSQITESDLREFGLVVLEKHQQRPLREKLSELVLKSDSAIVVDSIRDLSDIDQSILKDRPVWVWFIDANEATINERLRERAKKGRHKLPTGSAVDRTASIIKGNSDFVLPNGGSLEELRWKVDDEFFALIRLCRTVDLD